MVLLGGGGGGGGGMMFGFTFSYGVSFFRTVLLICRIFVVLGSCVCMCACVINLYKS